MYRPVAGDSTWRIDGRSRLALPPVDSLPSKLLSLRVLSNHLLSDPLLPNLLPVVLLSGLVLSDLLLPNLLPVVLLSGLVRCRSCCCISSCYSRYCHVPTCYRRICPLPPCCSTAVNEVRKIEPPVEAPSPAESAPTPAPAPPVAPPTRRPQKPLLVMLRPPRLTRHHNRRHFACGLTIPANSTWKHNSSPFRQTASDCSDRTAATACSRCDG